MKVALCIYSLARATQKHPEYQGPSLGPKFSTKNERNFSEEQIRKGRDGVIGLQSGTNKGASQVNIIISRNQKYLNLIDRLATEAWATLDTCNNSCRRNSFSVLCNNHFSLQLRSFCTKLEINTSLDCSLS